SRQPRPWLVNLGRRQKLAQPTAVPLARLWLAPTAQFATPRPRVVLATNQRPCVALQRGPRGRRPQGRSAAVRPRSLTRATAHRTDWPSASPFLRLVPQQPQSQKGGPTRRSHRTPNHRPFNPHSATHPTALRYSGAGG